MSGPLRSSQARWTLAVAAVVVAAVVAVAVALAAGDDDATVSARADPGGTTSTTESTTTVPAAVSTTAAPVATTGPAVAPTTTAPGSPPCRNSSEEACGPAYWDPPPGQNQPMRVEVSVSPASAKAGEPVTFRVVVTDPDARIDRECNSLALYGDGSGEPACATSASCLPRHGAWTPPERRADRHETNYTHVYAGAGEFTAAFSFRSSSGICLDDPYGSTATGQAIVRVAG